jgi:hypothetical protein
MFTLAITLTISIASSTTVAIGCRRAARGFRGMSRGVLDLVDTNTFHNILWRRCIQAATPIVNTSSFNTYLNATDRVYTGL